MNDRNASARHAIDRHANLAAPSPWIISRRADLVWFQGSVIAGLALLALFACLPRLDDTTYSATHPAVLVLLLWGVLFDGTHVFGTYARSYLAPDTGSRMRLPGGWSLALLFLGPVLALIDHVWFDQGPSMLGSAGLLFRIFLVGAYLYAYWHLVRQHYGFVVLYRRRAGLLSQREVLLENVVLWVGCLYPYLRFSLSDAYLRTGLPLVFPVEWLPLMRVGLDASFAAVIIPALLLLVLPLVAAGRSRLVPRRSDFAGFGRRSIPVHGVARPSVTTSSGAVERLAAGAPRRPRSCQNHCDGVLGPRHLLLAIVVGFHLLVFACLDNLLTITATLTLFHNLQYHRIVWQYERGKGRIPSGSLLNYLGFGVALAVAWYGPRVLGVALTNEPLVRNTLLGLGWGVAFHHYLVDGRIWRVRRLPGVTRALDAAASAAA